MEVPAHADTETLKRSRDYEILISDHTEKPRSEQEGQEPKEMITSEATPGRIVVETGIDVHSQKRPSQNDGLQKEEHGEMKMEGVESRQREENGEKNGGSIEMEKSKVKRESEEKGENKIAEGEATIVKLGPKSFKSSVDMFNYFHELSRSWPIDYNVNKVTHIPFCLFDCYFPMKILNMFLLFSYDDDSNVSISVWNIFMFTR